MSAQKWYAATTESDGDAEQRASIEARRIIEKKGIDWLIAAFVDASIGYYSPNAAAHHVEEILAGRKSYTERSMAVARGNPLVELRRDVEYMVGSEKIRPDETKKLIKLAAHMKNNDDYAKNGTFSMAYPTGVHQETRSAELV